MRESYVPLGSPSVATRRGVDADAAGRLKRAFDGLGSWSDASNRWAVAARPSIFRQPVGEANPTTQREALAPEPDLTALWLYLDTVRSGWRMMLFYSLLFMGAATYIGDATWGYTASRIGLSLGIFPAVASLIGEFDMIWRLLDLRAARRRIRAGGSDGETIALVRRAQSNHATLLIQVVAGLAVAVPVAVLR
jgi:hypothetical protein